MLESEGPVNVDASVASRSVSGTPTPRLRLVPPGLPSVTTIATLSQWARERQWEAASRHPDGVRVPAKRSLSSPSAPTVAELTAHEAEVLDAHGLRPDELGQAEEVVLHAHLGEVRPKCCHLVGLVVERHDRGGHQGVVEGPRQVFALSEAEEALPAGRDERVDPTLDR